MQYVPSSDFSAAAATAAVTLPEVLGGFSYALDLTEGQPAGHSLRACWIAMQLAGAAGLDETARATVYYAVLLKDLGCSSNAARVAQMFAGNDRRLKHDFKLIGPDPDHFVSFVLAKAGTDATEAEGGRAGVIDTILGNAGPILCDLIDTRCTRGADIARTLRFSEQVSAGIAGLDEHWDGSGLPHGVAGSAIPLASRIALLAQVADVFYMAGGGLQARREIARRSGGWFDPDLAALFLAQSASPDYWRALGSSALAARVAALAPAGDALPVDEAYLDAIAEAFGQVVDAKSPFTGGHSQRVGHITMALAAEMRLAEVRLPGLRRAAMLHDVGKLGVSSRILEKPGKLDAPEWAAMQAHARLTVDILSRVGPLADMAWLAGAHHERLDGRGYPLGLDAQSIALETRIISVADIFDALTADRPYRAAMPVSRAMDIIAGEVGSALDPACFSALRAVVARGGHRTPLPVIAGLD